MKDHKYAEHLELAKQATTKAGKCAVEMRNDHSFEVRFKGELDLVTSADLEAERIIVAEIKERFPEHEILSEEGSPVFSDRSRLLKPLWIIDPIDGTTNYAHGHFQVGISVAFADQGIVQAAVVYAPFYNETFWALRDAGAYLNETRIYANQNEGLKSALIATGFPYNRSNVKELIARLQNVLSEVRDVRRIGAASLDISWVAAGRLDGFYESVMPWDLAAAGLIAREAGALIGHILPQPSDSTLSNELYAEGVVVAAPKVFNALLEVLRRSTE